MATRQEHEQLQELWAKGRDDILTFCSIFGWEPHEQQKEMLLQFQHITTCPSGTYPDRRGLTKAGTGTGKTAAMAMCALWALFRHPQTRVIATAVTREQVKTVFLRECRQHIRNAPQFVQNMLSVEAQRIFVVNPNDKNDKDWAIESLIAKSAVAAQGRHFKYQFILAEEVSEIDNEIMDAFLGTLTEEYNVFYGIGNPNFRSGLLYRAFNGSKQFWPCRTTMNKLKLSTDPRPEIRKMAPAAKIEQIRQEYGEKHDMWRVRVLGEFPLAGERSAIRLDDLERAKTCNWKEAARYNPHIRRIAIDVARYGSDEIVIGARAGNALVHVEILHGMDGHDVAQEAVRIEQQLGFDPDETLYIVDGIGVGASVVDFLNRVHERMFYSFGSNRAAPDSKYKNMASMAWGNTAEILEKQPVYLGSDPEMHDQLAQREYTVLEDEDNAYKIESKDDYRKRAGSSPDRADMVVMAFYDGCDDFGSGEVWAPARDEKEINRIADSIGPEEPMVFQPSYRPDSLLPYNTGPIRLFG